MKKLFAIITLLTALSSALAKGVTVNFDSKEDWKSPRWYLIGELKDRTIEWLSGGSTRLPKCAATAVALARTPIDLRLINSADEVLLARPGWIAVRVDPAKRGDTLELRYNDDCKVKAPVAWAADATAKGDVLVPYLFLNPKNNVYMGNEFNVSLPASSTSVDIQLDIVGGGWQVQLGSAQSDAKQTLISAPVVEARGEWHPPNLGGIGFELQMLQGLASFGGITSQNILISEWLAGFYHESVFPIAQGLVFRLHANFFQHLADQGTEVRSLASFEANHRAINLGLSLAQYFAKRWHVQMRGDYGYPSDISGAGVRQSNLLLKTQVGYMVTDSVSWLVEGAYRRFDYEGQASTKAISVATGIRLEL